MNQPELCFDGASYVAEHDQVRLSGLLARVFYELSNGRWYTLRELQEQCGGSEAGISARIRDLRKTRFGGYTIERRRRGDPSSGLHEYRMAK
jgi:hypothetical protein